MASEVENQFNLKLLTWNINGIRSFEDFTEILLKSEADIICIQETKVGLIFSVKCLLLSSTCPGDQRHVDRECRHSSRVHIVLCILQAEVRIQWSGNILQILSHASSVWLQSGPGKYGSVVWQTSVPAKSWNFKHPLFCSATDHWPLWR